MQFWKSLLAISTFILVVLFIKNRVGSVVRYTIIIALSINILLTLFLLNFLDIFVILHQILFKNSSWLFQPNSILIEWFHLSYFMEFFTIFIILNYLIFYIFHKLSNH